MNWFHPYLVSWPVAAALLVLRLVVGIALMQHGKPKLGQASGWMQAWGLPPAPGLLQVLVVVAEFFGGLALVLGLLTRLAGLGVLCVMLGALFRHHLPKGDPFVAPGKASYELALVFAAIGLLFLALGPGTYSLDYLLFR